MLFTVTETLLRGSGSGMRVACAAPGARLDPYTVTSEPGLMGCPAEKLAAFTIPPAAIEGPCATAGIYKQTKHSRNPHALCTRPKECSSKCPDRTAFILRTVQLFIGKQVCAGVRIGAGILSERTVLAGEEYQRLSVLKSRVDHLADEDIVIAGRDGLKHAALQVRQGIRK